MLANDLFEMGAVKFGNFTWTSGKKAPYYVDLRVVPSYPNVFDQVARGLARLIRMVPEHEACKLAGVPLAGISFATAAALELKMPLLFVRKELKEHGTGKIIEGVYGEEDGVVIVEDVVSMGGSTLKTAKILREAGLTVNHAVAVLDHGKGGKAALEAEGIHLHALANMEEMVTSLVGDGLLGENELKTVREFIRNG